MNKKYWVDDDGYIIYGDDDNHVIVCEMYPEHVQALTRIIESYNEAKSGIPAEDQHGRESYATGTGHIRIVPDKVKPLAQYLDEYIEHEAELRNVEPPAAYMYAYNSWRELLEQAFDAYESTEQVKIRIESV